LNKQLLRVVLIFIFFILLFPVGFLDAMNWPSGDAVLINNFGANNRGKPVLGMIFDGGTDVIAAESGEVIFSRGKNDTRSINAASRLPSPLGSWTAVDHGDGLISIYSRYSHENDFMKTDQYTRIEKEQIIASSGISGWSVRNGFYFMIFDRRERRWINPAMILTPRQETRPPQIISFELRNAQGNIVGSRNISQGRYMVLVNAEGGTVRQVPGIVTQYAPYRIVCSVNGAEAGSLNFEAFSARDGVLMVTRNGLVSARQVYANSPFFEAADVFLTRGQVTLEIIVQDINGASRSMSSRLIVN
jgi:hypothetical protein